MHPIIFTILPFYVQGLVNYLCSLTIFTLYHDHLPTPPGYPKQKLLPFKTSPPAILPPNTPRPSLTALVFHSTSCLPELVRAELERCRIWPSGVCLPPHRIACFRSTAVCSMWQSIPLCDRMRSSPLPCRCHTYSPVCWWH